MRRLAPCSFFGIKSERTFSSVIIANFIFGFYAKRRNNLKNLKKSKIDVYTSSFFYL